MNWTSCTLGEIAPFSYGKSLPATQRNPGSIPVVSSAGITGEHDHALVEGPCVIIGRKGSIGSVYYLDTPSYPIDTVFFTQGSSQIDLKYLYYLLKTLPFSLMNTDSAVPGLNRTQAEALVVDIPPKSEQQQIAATLGALDDKIESNMRLVKLIPEIISVYVAKELENNCSEVPVSNLAEFVNGGAYTKGASGNGRVVIRIAELNSGIGSSTVYNNIEAPDNKTARVGDILMSWSGTLGVYVWTLDEAIINQHIFKVLPKEYPSWLVFDRLNSVISEFRAIAADKATTMGHIRRDHLTSTLVEIPERAGIKRLNETCGPLWRKYISAQLEINELSSLRDALLPELMSGRIRVRVTEVSG